MAVLGVDFKHDGVVGGLIVGKPVALLEPARGGGELVKLMRPS
jgi:hypothetical protein